MSHYRKIVFHHANLNRPVHIVAGTIAGYHYSEPTKCNIIYTTAGIFPVSETLEEIDQKIESLAAAAPQGEINEQSKAVRRPAVNVRKRKAR